MDFDHPAHVGCFLAVMQHREGEICVLCYHHVITYSVVTISRPKRMDLMVCQHCGNALHACGRFSPEIVRRLYDVLLRRLQFDMHAARMKQEIEDYVPGEEVVH